MTDLAIQNPFALLTLIVAPALLTNASTVLALSTSNRFLRAGERLRALAEELQTVTAPEEADWRLVHVNRIERQAVLLLTALRAIYVALGSFERQPHLDRRRWARFAQLHPADELMIVLALAVGFLGAAAIVWSSVNLFRATRLSMMNIAEEAAIIRQREERRRAGQQSAA